MIKKIVPLAAICFFAFAILFVSIKRTTVDIRPSLAAAKIKFSVSPAPSPAATVSPTPKSNYFLVYPGILPDSPLYQLKMVRDRIWIWLTSGTVERANLFLLYADKRVGAGKALIEGNKVGLGVSTILKGEKYLERAIKEIEKAKKEGKEVGLQAGKIKNALLKYEEVLFELEEKVNPEGKAAIEDLLKFMKTLQEKATKI